MTSRDYCNVCGGAQQVVKGTRIIPCGRCKDTNGWEPEAWYKEHPESQPKEPSKDAGGEKP